MEQIFVEAGLGTPTCIDYIKDTKAGLGLFLRSLTGLERDVAALAFDTSNRPKC